ncbi:hypothetical protein GUJ93_ZPchr0010g8790 [Zizania palustris]|uniref:Uncharacterized protein n=1 Tax=Zizania palustris TaxID=103762 RepID=A0A8J5W1A3_ZIZPA|nr:hypothetical protein GUJ93_ZPchr0010g8790 [Zizania palustris]
MKADEKVQTLLVEVLRRCDSILDALGGTRGGGSGGSVVLGVSGGINTVGTGSDVARDNVASVVLHGGANVILALDAASGILISTGVVITRQDTLGNVLTIVHDSIPSSGGKVVLLRDRGFEWPVGNAVGTHNLGTCVSGSLVWRRAKIAE